MDVLHDDILLEIFDFYVDKSPLDERKTEILDIYPYKSPWDKDNYKKKKETETWQLLVHVCRRWRSLVLGSPRRLNLRLYCTPKTPAKDILDVWPALPLIVRGDISLSSRPDNVIAALGQNNRVCQVDLDLTGFQVEGVVASIRVPFPKLTNLLLFSYDLTLVIPDSFLDGSAPRLRYFELYGISFPGLPKLLLSANHLANLRLINIPHLEYNSPEAMVVLLSMLSSESLFLEFRYSESRPDWESRSLPPQKRSILPALHEFHFKGVTEYLEELVTRIDTPQLNQMLINFSYQVDFDCPRLAQFIDRTPTLRVRDEAHVQFDDRSTSVQLLASPWTLTIEFPCREPRRQLSSVARVCNSSLLPLSMVEDLYIEWLCRARLLIFDAIENTRWLQLFLPFTAVKNLFLSEVFARGIAAALQELVGGRITEVLPSLQNTFVGGYQAEPFRENTVQFAAARRHSGHPIAISVWGRGGHKYW